MFRGHMLTISSAMALLAAKLPKRKTVKVIGHKEGTAKMTGPVKSRAERRNFAREHKLLHVWKTMAHRRIHEDGRQIVEIGN